jgi:hypothetical protein
MMASPTLPAAQAVANGRFIPHGRLPSRRHPRHRVPVTPGPEELEAAEGELTALYLRTQEFAWLTNRVIFAVSDGQRLDLIFADSYVPVLGETIEFVAWPPGWFYRPARKEKQKR